MAFIVPVMKKDYNLYAGSPKGTVIRAKVGRSNSSPVKVSLPAERIFMERRPTRNSYEHRHSVPAVPATNFANRRRNSRRVSVRHLSSTESTESTCTDDSKRRVRFGICEEYEYESSDEEPELEHLHDRTKKTFLAERGRVGDALVASCPRQVPHPLALEQPGQGPNV
ncbi:hypothetical protein M3Y99_00394500 [Aphelenchoides fujianensis]|nr:hypothetical protein M3Y99_00394500 [Aphelenchoides fujianensis]